MPEQVQGFNDKTDCLRVENRRRRSLLGQASVAPVIHDAQQGAPAGKGIAYVGAEQVLAACARSLKVGT
jgi:hypothetical protein